MKCRGGTGFTLLEVLVALALVATALTLGYSSVRNAALGSERLYQRVLAQWVADNRRAEILTGARRVTDKPQTVAERQLGRQFVATVAPADDDGIIVVTVSGDNAPLARVETVQP